MADAGPRPRTMIEATGLTRSFPSGDGVIEVLRGIDLEVGAATVTAVIGRSGAGKTTLLNLVVGLDRPDGGRISVAGADLGAQDDAGLARLRRDGLGYVPQAPSLLPVLSAAENVEVPLRLRRTPPAERDARVAAVLDEVGLGPRRDHRPDELSGGEQQRVAVARALVARPALLVADEPTAQLDHDTSHALAVMLRGRVEGEGLTLLLATNDPALLEIADAVLELRDGRLQPGGGALSRPADRR